ncbi:GGDEF domain-containing protein [Photobacterium chitinilyticum]|uniref:diguanylate cyclase n=1 Tax=Photobacterium chitinilyticum TaxID=2485123 RepID=A0A3S3RHN5_9GAMM|nr:GGDEF domain-containing protein [Photobacterium chitinilyticum]RWX55613.1 GGDEF domain-containing protein [Photobacterium chitinilyticum]
MPPISFAIFRSAGVRFGLPLLLAALMIMSLEPVLASFSPYRGLLLVLPYILLVLVILLSQPFNQGKTALTALLMMIAFYIIQNHLQSPLSDNRTHIIYVLLATLLPLNLLQLHLLPERRLFSRFGTGYLIFLISQLAWGTLVVNHFTDQDLGGLWDSYLYALPDISPLPVLLILLYLGIGLACASAILKRNRGYDQAIFTSLLFAGITFSAFDQDFISSTAFSVAAVLLLLNLITCSHELAYVDQLTGIPGRRALETELKHLGRTYTLAMLDVDHFKKFNDTHGHKTGDDVLRLVAQFMQQVKGGAEVFRYGGEEFTVLFKGKESNQCIEHLEQLRQDIANYEMSIRQYEERPSNDQKGAKLRIKSSKQETVTVTVSIGLADSFPDHNPSAVLKAADEALYKAKKSGRNKLSQ